MATRKTARKTVSSSSGSASAASRGAGSSDTKESTKTSPVGEMGAEDESPGEANRSTNKTGPQHQAKK